MTPRPRPDAVERPARPVVALSGLRHAWRADATWRLSIDAFVVERGERVLLRGPSGSGKSTLLSLICGVIGVQHGSVQVLGCDLARLSGPQRDRFRADHIGVVFQMFNLLSYLSVLENVCLPCAFSATRRRRCEDRDGAVAATAVALLRHLDLADPELVHRPVTELSVGQQQRVAVARALIGAPELIVADEPTSSLDAARRESFLDLLFRTCEREGSTLLFVTHDAALDPFFDRTIDLDDLARAIGRVTSAAIALLAARSLRIARRRPR